MNNAQKLNSMAKANLIQPGYIVPGSHPSYWGARCVLQLQYASELSKNEGRAFDALVAEAIDVAWDAFNGDGAITAPVTARVEQALAPIAGKAKAYTLLCVGHAHIDMNWMWSYDETVSIVLDTFRTMLDLMDEYPAFTFSQSQASVYRIVEQHCPEMLAEIKRRVHEGRWEVTASTWVEADRNMPNLESMARHLLYTKRYLSGLLDIDPASLNIDYEPDTFGHHVNVPEALCDGGVKYYYHCRGYDKHPLYNWKAPSGRSILVYLEMPTWYIWTMHGHCALLAPEFCKRHGLQAMLRVYGVGDHGGGPTRRDIESILEMNTWPIFPQYKFGTYGEFFRLAEQNRDAYPVVEGELNFVFDGCYTTQTRQKRGNRHAEALLAEAEGAAALTGTACAIKYDNASFARAWQKVLFNQFHDILPGSGVVETREYAMGQYQEANAVANTARTAAVRALSAAMDTSGLAGGEDIGQTRSEGAGAGYGIREGGVTQVGRHAGVRRIFTVYNPLPFVRQELVQITAWDWPGDSSRIGWTDATGNILPHQLTGSGRDHYWGHFHTDTLVYVNVPAMGCTCIVMDETGEAELVLGDPGPRVDMPFTGILENECIRAELDICDGGIVSLVDKRTGVEYVRPGCPLGVFRLVEEDPIRGMSAWRVGRYMNIHALNRGVRFKQASLGPQHVRQSLTYEMEFGNDSAVTVTVSLDAGRRMLEFDTTVRWRETGSDRTFFPQLNFFMPVAYDYTHIRYDVPMGMLDRAPLEMDVPAQSFGMPINSSGNSLMLISDSKYGYRGTRQGLSLTLIRSSVDPDPCPEIGEHRIRIAIALDRNDAAEEAMTAAAFCRKLLPMAAKPHTGTLPVTFSMMRLQADGIVLSAVKQAESGDGIVVRYYEVKGRAGRGSLAFYKAPKAAFAINVLEQPVEGFATVNGDTVCFEYRAYGVGGLLVRF